MNEAVDRSSRILAFGKGSVDERESGADCDSHCLGIVDRQLGRGKRASMFDRIEPGISLAVDIGWVVRAIEIADADFFELAGVSQSAAKGPKQRNDDQACFIGHR